MTAGADDLRNARIELETPLLPDGTVEQAEIAALSRHFPTPRNVALARVVGFHRFLDRVHKAPGPAVKSRFAPSGAHRIAPAATAPPH